MSNQTEFSIKISTPAELEGAKAVEASLERQIGKAKALGKDYSDLEAKLKVIKDANNQAAETFKREAEAAQAKALALRQASQQAVEATEKEAKAVKATGESLDEAGKKTNELAIKKSDLGKVVHALSEDFPIMGRLAAFALNPVVGALTIVVGITAAVVQSVRSIGDAFKDVDTTKWKDISDEARSVRDSVTNAKIAAGDFKKEISETASAQTNLANATASAIGKIREQARAMIERTSAEAALKTAQVDDLLARKKISEPEAIKRRADIRKEMIDSKGAIEANADQQELAALEKEYKARQAALPQIERDAMEKRGRATQIGQREARFDSVKSRNEANIATAKQRLEQLQEEVAELEKSTGSYLDKEGIPLPGASVPYLGAEVGQKLFQKRQTIKKIETFLATDSATASKEEVTRADRKIEQNSANADANAAESLLRQEIQRQKEVAQQIASTREKVKSAGTERSAIGNLEKQTIDVQTSTQIFQVQEQERERAARAAEAEQKRKAREQNNSIKDEEQLINGNPRRHGGGDEYPDRDKSSSVGSESHSQAVSQLASASKSGADFIAALINIATQQASQTEALQQKVDALSGLVDRNESRRTNMLS